VEHIYSIIAPYLPYVGIALPLIAGLISLAVRGELDDFARSTVGAVYRVGIHAADALADESIAWLKGSAGIAYRRHLAELAYDSLPSTIRGIPVGLVKSFVSRERWCELVEDAFQSAVSIAEKLELPEELPTA
jgi:hypothetical protein